MANAAEQKLSGQDRVWRNVPKSGYDIGGVMMTSDDSDMTLPVDE